MIRVHIYIFVIPTLYIHDVHSSSLGSFCFTLILAQGWCDQVWIFTCLHCLPGEYLEYLGDALLVLDHAELDEEARQAVLVVLLQGVERIKSKDLQIGQKFLLLGISPLLLQFAEQEFSLKKTKKSILCPFLNL